MQRCLHFVYRQSRRSMAALVILALFSVAPAYAEHFDVSNTNDSGVGFRDLRARTVTLELMN